MPSLSTKVGLMLHVNQRRACLFILLIGCVFVEPASAHKPDTTPKPSAFLGDSNRFVAVDSMESAAIYSAEDGKQLHKLSVAGRINKLAVTTDHKFVCIACGNGSISVWDTATGENLWAKLPGELGYIYDVSFAWDGNRLVASDNVGAVVYDAVTGNRIWRFGESEIILSAALSPDGTKGVFVGIDERLFTFDVLAKKTTATGLETGRPLRYSSDGKHVVCIASVKGQLDWVRKIRVFTMGEKILVKDAGDFSPYHLRPIASGLFLVTCAGAGVIFNPETGEAKEIWKTDAAVEDFDQASLLGVSTRYNLITRVTDLRTGKIAFTIDNSANYRDSEDLLGGLILTVLKNWPLLVAVATVVMLVGVLVVYLRANRRKARKLTP